MGFFNSFNKTSPQLPASSKYTWENVAMDSMILASASFDSFLFINSRLINTRFSNYISQYSEAKQRGRTEEADRIREESWYFIEKNVQRINYEEDVQYTHLQTVVGCALDDLFTIVEVIKNIDGQRSQQYFAGFSLNPDQVVETITQNVSQIIAREHNLYLREHLTNLEELKRYSEAYTQMQENDGSVGSIFTSALGGLAAVANPLLGVGLIAKGIYDGYQCEQRSSSQTEKLSSLRRKWIDSRKTLRESENNALKKVEDFVAEKVGTAFDELRQAVSQYCNENGFSVEAVCDAIYQARIDNGNIHYASEYTEEQKDKTIVLFSNVLSYDKLSQGVRTYCERSLNNLR